MKKVIPITHDDEQPIEVSQNNIEELAETAEKQLSKSKSVKIDIQEPDEDIIENVAEKEDLPSKPEVSQLDDKPNSEEEVEPEEKDVAEAHDSKEDEVDEIQDSENEHYVDELDEEDIELDEQGNPLDKSGEESEPEVESESIDSAEETGLEATGVSDGEKDLAGNNDNKTDAELDAKVDDIVRNESDELLNSEDKELAAAFEPLQKRSFSAKVKNFFKAWVHSPRARWATLFAVFIIAAVVAVVPTGRYFALNLVGVRSKASLQVRDDRTQQPLKNVQVSLAGQRAKTDKNGKVSFSELRLGPTNLVIEKRAFATINKKVTVGWGSNPLGEFKVSAVGTLYNFSVKDWLSDKPLDKVEASSGEASAFSDAKGKLVLAIDKDNEGDVKVDFTLDGYRKESITITENDKTEQTVALTASRKHIFVSKRSGKFDVYKIDADGKNEKILVAATGSEREDMVLVPHQVGEVSAFVSTRENIRNKDGFLMSSLFILDIESGQLQKIGRSERVQVVGWLGDRLVYVLVSEGVSDSNPRRHKLVSYNYKEGTSKELAYANYFNDILIAGKRIYYAPSNAFLDNTSNAKLFSINPDGTDQQVVLAKESWNVFRTSYETLSISTGKEWYTHTIGGGSATKSQSAPSQLKTKIFLDNSDQTKALWADERDGKGVLLEYSTKTRTERILLERVGLNYPIYWLSNTYAVFRVAGNNETADYVVSTRGGEAKKIRDVSDTGGIDSWYYY